jgi:hypothetical protein
MFSDDEICYHNIIIQSIYKRTDFKSPVEFDNFKRIDFKSPVEFDNFCRFLPLYIVILK